MKSQKNVIVVVNPISGGRDKSLLIESILDYAKSIELNPVMMETSGEGDDIRLKEMYAKYTPERVVVAGGDGTIKFVAETLGPEDVIIGIIPAGSANGLSVDLNFPTEPEAQLEIAFSDHYLEIDMIRINEHHSLHLSDLGLNAELIRNYENGSIRGKLGYALQSVNTLTDDPVEFTARIEANGKTIDAETKMVVIANSQKYGTGVTINPIGKMNDGVFEIVVLHNLDLVVFGKIISGNMPLESDDVEIIATKKARITTDIPVHFQVDGEYIGEVNQLDIEILPRQMKVAIPRA